MDIGRGWRTGCREDREGGRTGRASELLWGRKINEKIKGKTCRKVVKTRPMSRAETLKKAQENKIEVAEMRKLRWTCRLTKLDRIRNERVRGQQEGEISNSRK